MSADLMKAIRDIATVESDLMFGCIVYDVGGFAAYSEQIHPADRLDIILQQLYKPLTNGEKISTQHARNIVVGLKKFQKSFGILLSSPISEIELYIRENQAADNIPTLSSIRKKYIGRKVVPAQLHDIPDVWNIEAKNDKLHFHYYWSDGADTYLDHVEIKIDEDSIITGIMPLFCERQKSCDIRRSVYSNCKATWQHYYQFGIILEAGTAEQ